MGTRWQRKYGWIVLLVLGLESHPALALTYYVRSGGSDVNDGLSPAAAFATIGRGAHQLVNGGDRVIVGPGTYREGNITPRRGGLAGAPVEFVADSAGTFTGDPAGEVRVVPQADDETQTTGFILFGRRHVVIDGFTIVGARDAGIQVRPSSRTASDSANITLRNNLLLDGGKGLSVEASGDVVVERNLARGNSGNGLTIVGGADTTRIRVIGNTLQSNLNGLRVNRGADVVVRNNEVADNPRGTGMLFGEARNLEVTGNRISKSKTGLELRPGDPSSRIGKVVIDDNQIEDGERLLVGYAEVDLHLSGNQLSSLGHARVHVNIASAGSLQAMHNHFSGIAMQLSGEDVVLTHNEMPGTYAGVSGKVVIADSNTGASWLEVTAAVTARLTKNESGTVIVDAPFLELRENHLSTVELTAGLTATVAANVIEDQLFFRPAAATSSPGAVARAAELGAGVRIETNQIGALRLGRLGNSLARDVVVERNTVERGVEIHCIGNVSVLSNRIRAPEVSGLIVRLSGLQSRVAVVDNTISASRFDGMFVAGAKAGTIADNQVEDSGDTGIAVRGSSGLVIERNRVQGSGHGGIGIDTDSPFVTDCDGSGTITTTDISMALGLALRGAPATTCTALDTSEDQLVTVDELVKAVTDSAGTEPSAVAGSIEQVVADNRINDTRVYGIKIFSKQPVRVRDNRLRDNVGVGITVTGYQGVALVAQGNRIEGSGDSGLRLAAAASAEVEANVVAGSRDNGIHVDGVGQVEVGGNQVSGNQHVGIVVENALRVHCRGNQVESNAGGGIELVGVRGGTTLQTEVVDNQIEGSDGTCLILEGTSGGGVYANTIARCGLDGIRLRGSGGVAVADNLVADVGTVGIEVGSDSDFDAGGIVERNQVADTGLSGIKIHASGVAIVRDNEVLHSGASGIVLVMQGDPAQAVVVGNTIGSSGVNGLSTEGLTRATLQNNLVFNHSDSGIRVARSRAVQVANNLVYNNLRGIRFGDEDSGEEVTGSIMLSNTIFRNRLAGIVLGTRGGASMDAYIEHNIISGNGGIGLAVHANSLSGLVADFNLNTDGYRLSPFDESNPLSPGMHDINADPLFVDPDGADGVLGGDGYLDDDFRLRNGEMVSPAIDAGRTEALGLGISGYAAESTTFDAGLVDLGFHYGASPRIE